MLFFQLLFVRHARTLDFGEISPCLRGLAFQILLTLEIAAQFFEQPGLGARDIAVVMQLPRDPIRILATQQQTQQRRMPLPVALREQLAEGDLLLVDSGLELRCGAPQHAQLIFGVAVPPREIGEFTIDVRDRAFRCPQGAGGVGLISLGFLQRAQPLPQIGEIVFGRGGRGAERNQANADERSTAGEDA